MWHNRCSRFWLIIILFHIITFKFKYCIWIHSNPPFPLINYFSPDYFVLAFMWRTKGTLFPWMKMIWFKKNITTRSSDDRPFLYLKIGKLNFQPSNLIPGFIYWTNSEFLNGCYFYSLKKLKVFYFTLWK